MLRFMRALFTTSLLMSFFRIGVALVAGLLSTLALAQITIEDSEGPKVFDAPPQRIAALNWDLAEQLLELNITPVAMPEIADYRDWVMHPEVPDSVEDIGGRVEPNLEKLAQLNPDVIVIASPQLDLKPRLQQIAPVVFFQTYSSSHHNPEAAMNTFRQLARLTETTALAEQKLAAQQARFEVLKAQVAEAWSGKPPKVATLRFANETSVYLYGDNSMSQYVLSKLGIAPALHFPANQWGVTQTRLLELAKISDGVVLYFLPYEQEQTLLNSRLWKAMPFVQRHRFHSVAPSWSYGGAMSLSYMAENLASSLIELAEKQ